MRMVIVQNNNLLIGEMMPRGKGKKEAMVHINIRIPKSVLGYYQQFPNYTVRMRQVLEGCVSQNAVETNLQDNMIDCNLSQKSS